MALYLGVQKIAGNGGGSGEDGQKHVYLAQSEYDALSAAGLLSVDVIYMTESAGGGGGGGGLVLGELSSTAYRGDRGKAAYDHSRLKSGNPHNTTAADVGALPSTTVVPTKVSQLSNDSGYTKLKLGTTSATAYRGDYGNTAYAHSQVTSGNPHGTTAADVGALPSTTKHTSGDVENLAGASGIKVVSSSTEIVSTTDNVLYFVTGS